MGTSEVIILEQNIWKTGFVLRRVQSRERRNVFKKNPDFSQRSHYISTHFKAVLQYFLQYALEHFKVLIQTKDFHSSQLQLDWWRNFCNRVGNASCLFLLQSSSSQTPIPTSPSPNMKDKRAKPSLLCSPLGYLGDVPLILRSDPLLGLSPGSALRDLS